MNRLTQDTLIFVGAFFALVILWFVTGGAKQAARLAVNPVVVDGSGHVVQEAGSSAPNKTSVSTAGQSSGSAGSAPAAPAEDPRYAWIKNKSPYFHEVTLTAGNTYSTDPSQQYMVLSAASSNKSSLDVTGWQLMSTSTGAIATIGKATVLPGLSSVDYSEALYLAPGATAYVVSGPSPIGISFQSNKCMGWYAQANNFTPSINWSCPRISDDPLPAAPNALDDQCLNYLQGISSCQYPNSIPEYLSHACQVFIADHSTYNSCLSYHKSDSDFYSKQWWVYLNHAQPIWKSQRETIELLDGSGKVVDLVSYGY